MLQKEKRHAFLILAHHKPEQLNRLLKALKHPNFDLYLHIDTKSSIVLSKLETIQYRCSIYNISWGGFRMIEATLHLLQEARKNHHYWSYTLLSGADFPTKSNEYINQFLSQIDASLLSYWHDDDPSWFKRYQRYFFNDLSNPFKRIFNGVSRRLAKILPHRSPPKGIKIHFGYQWWILNQEGVKAVFDFLEERKDFWKFSKNVHIPDEMFFQTALTNSRKSPLLKRQHATYVDWSARGAHPKILGLDDLKKMSASKFLFARKFDEDKVPGILDAVTQLRHLH